MNVFTKENASDLTNEERSILNTEAESRVPEIMKALGCDEEQAINAFQDEVASR